MVTASFQRVLTVAFLSFTSFLLRGGGVTCVLLARDMSCSLLSIQQPLSEKANHETFIYSISFQIQSRRKWSMKHVVGVLERTLLNGVWF